jgi:two-component system NtrC family sensor kinase
MLAVFLPVIGLSWILINYSESRYQQEIDREMAGLLQTYITFIENRLRYEQEVIERISTAPALQNFQTALYSIAKDELPKRYEVKREKLNLFLENLQRTVPGLGVIRVLDTQGRVLLKSTLGQASMTYLESVSGGQTVEPEDMYAPYLSKLERIQQGELTRLALHDGSYQQLGMLYSVLPLTSEGRRVGYITVNTFGEYIDRVLNLAPRQYAGQLTVIEQNPDHTIRDGLVLYDDQQEQRFSDVVLRQSATQTLPALWRYVQGKPYGVYRGKNQEKSIHFIEYYPYPDSLVSWVLLYELDKSVASAPYDRLKRYIVLFGTLALLAGLVLSRTAAKRIARPITQLASNLKAFADKGERNQIDKPNTDELGQLCESFSYMSNKLDEEQAAREQAERLALQKEKMASIGEMAAGIGHEINNPLSNMTNLVSLMKKTNTDELTQNDLKLLEGEMGRVRSIVQGVMNFAKQIPPNHQRFELEPWLTSAVQLCEDEAAEHDVWLEVSHCSPACFIEADSPQLQQVLINLINNAIHASQPEDKVTISAQCLSDKVHVEVLDNGKGIDEAALENIYMPFYTTKAVNKGTGLGLSICLGIVQYHGGLLTINNRKNHAGVRAVMEIPLNKTRPTSKGLMQETEDA